MAHDEAIDFEKNPISFSSKDASPYANRIKIMWSDFRKVILEKSGKMETSYVSSLIEFDSNSLWIGTGNGLYLYNYKKNKVLNKLHKSDRENNGLSNGTVQSLLRSRFLFC